MKTSELKTGTDSAAISNAIANAVENKTSADKALEKLKAKDAKDEQLVKDIGEKIIRKTGEVGELYLTLCQKIRSEQIAPTVVSKALTELGFHRTRVSELNKIAMSPDDIWNQYEAKAIGLKKALQMARLNNFTGEVETTPAMKMLGMPENEAIEIEGLNPEQETTEKQTHIVTPAERKELIFKHLRAIAKLTDHVDTAFNWKGKDGDSNWQITRTASIKTPKTNK